jgi:hypothetical protein
MCILLSTLQIQGEYTVAQHEALVASRLDLSQQPGQDVWTAAVDAQTAATSG